MRRWRLAVAYLDCFRVVSWQDYCFEVAGDKKKINIQFLEIFTKTRFFDFSLSVMHSLLLHLLRHHSLVTLHLLLLVRVVVVMD